LFFLCKKFIIGPLWLFKEILMKGQGMGAYIFLFALFALVFFTIGFSVLLSMALYGPSGNGTDVLEPEPTTAVPNPTRVEWIQVSPPPSEEGPCWIYLQYSEIYCN
jgi:hypothetical protein